MDAAAVLPAKVAEEVALAAEAAAAREGVSAGAPGMRFSSRSEVVSGLTAHRNVAAALADARTLVTGDVRLGKWLPLLEEAPAGDRRNEGDTRNNGVTAELSQPPSILKLGYPITWHTAAECNRDHLRCPRRRGARTLTFGTSACRCL